MPFTRSTFLRILKISASVIIVLLIISYALWRSLAYARGPHITLLEPANYSSISTPTTNITGRVERANTITLNGKAITIDEQGNFNETIIIFPGINILTFEAHDQFGRIIREQLQVMRP